MKNTLQHRGWVSRIRLLAASVALALPVMLVPTLVANPSAQAQTFTVLYSFTGGADGYAPFAGLIRDAAGNLYGTTIEGGGSNEGTVFKLDTTGAETVLHSFTGAPLDGKYPNAGLVRDAVGNLYGTTYLGGTSDKGTVFKVDTTGTETVLHSFAGGPTDGARPLAALVWDPAGNLYGTTGYGGAFRSGTVFKVDTIGTETVLYSFTGRVGGSTPYAALFRDAAGNFYGTTISGGASNNCSGGCGTVFKLDTTGKETVLHGFRGGTADGANPYSSLIRDAAGNFYGTTFGGGGSELGTVFKLDTTGKETVLHSFTGMPDGLGPYAGLLRDAAGNLYGTTNFGGGSNMGTVFKLDTTGSEIVLHSFTGMPDGTFPYAGLLRDAAGNLYGTTSYGGASGFGTVFKLGR
jgi:uncharacterized repeat protein (TIGR03803 family)